MMTHSKLLDTTGLISRFEKGCDRYVGELHAILNKTSSTTLFESSSTHAPRKPIGIVLLLLNSLSRNACAKEVLTDSDLRIFRGLSSTQ